MDSGNERIHDAAARRALFRRALVIHAQALAIAVVAGLGLWFGG
jgi:hypothetical protein